VGDGARRIDRRARVECGVIVNPFHSSARAGSGSRIRAGVALALFALVFGACAQSETVRPTKSLRKPFGSTPSNSIRQTPIEESPTWSPPPTYEPPPPPKPAPPVLRDLKGMQIVVDAGHGGKDPGAKGISPSHEKHIALDLANQLASELRARGASVTMTRSKDVFIELEGRAAIAEKSRTDLFVSVHADSHANPTISGATIYIARNASGASRKIATAIEGAMKRSGVPVRGVRTAGFVVLIKHSRPAVLIESGYLTNSTDSRNLNDAAYRARLAKTLADGIQSGLRG